MKKENLEKIYESLTSYGFFRGDVVPYHMFCEVCSILNIEPEDDYIESMESIYEISIG